MEEEQKEFQIYTTDTFEMTGLMKELEQKKVEVIYLKELLETKEEEVKSLKAANSNLMEIISNQNATKRKREEEFEESNLASTTNELPETDGRETKVQKTQAESQPNSPITNDAKIKVEYSPSVCHYTMVDNKQHSQEKDISSLDRPEVLENGHSYADMNRTTEYANCHIKYSHPQPQLLLVQSYPNINDHSREIGHSYVQVMTPREPNYNINNQKIEQSAETKFKETSLKQFKVRRNDLTQIHDRYQRVLQVIRTQGCSKRQAYKIAKVPRSTVRDMIGIAELQIVEKNAYDVIIRKMYRTSSVKMIERVCRSKLGEMKEKMGILRSIGQLLPIAFNDEFYTTFKQRK